VSIYINPYIYRYIYIYIQDSYNVTAREGHQERRERTELLGSGQLDHDRRKEHAEQDYQDRMATTGLPG
jgi:hypothetical protein